MNYLYFARSMKNGKVYVGFTAKDPKIRVKEHNEGSNRWSSSNKPLKLIYYESYICEQDAKQREKFYKSGFGKKIKSIIVQELGP